MKLKGMKQEVKTYDVYVVSWYENNLYHQKVVNSLIAAIVLYKQHDSMGASINHYKWEFEPEWDTVTI